MIRRFVAQVSFDLANHVGAWRSPLSGNATYRALIFPHLPIELRKRSWAWSARIRLVGPGMHADPNVAEQGFPRTYQVDERTLHAVNFLLIAHNN
jgi:hypothetical protein